MTLLKPADPACALLVSIAHYLETFSYLLSSNQTTGRAVGATR
ncbi:hypothetical protein Mpsy_3145 [Methanolobus psychrophilus R15]|nr:hypothetical protein Mpsy_3145 [Methanolobus psychrophilus R15]